MYPYEAMDMPYGKFRSLPNAETYLKPGLDFTKLNAIANGKSDNEAAQAKHEAHRRLFRSLTEQERMRACPRSERTPRPVSFRDWKTLSSMVSSFQGLAKP